MAIPEGARPNGGAGEADALREAFVEMLFALAVSQVAIYAADITSVQSRLLDKLPSLAHLGIGLLLIATSWVGWRQSASPGMKERIQYVFSRPFLGLLFDVLLVILYFIVVRSVEIEERAGEIALTPYTARPEALWVCVVFAVYVLWDLLSDVFCEGGIPQVGLFPWIKKACAAALVSTFASLICVLLSFGIYELATARTELRQVVFLDLMLGCVILLFRLLKAAENKLAPLMGVKDCKAFVNPRQTQGNEMYLSVLLFVLILAFLLGAMNCS